MNLKRIILNKRIFTVATATMLMGFGLQAQNNVSYVETSSIKGKEKTSINACEKPNLRENPTIDGNTYMIVKEWENIMQNGKNAVSYENIPRLNALKKRDLRQYTNLPEINFKKSLSVKKSSRDDVATATLMVVGDPWYDGSGFHLLLDADHLLFEKFMDDIYVYWHEVYDDCDYFIPEDAIPDPFTTNFILDGCASINIPEGIYDFTILNPDPNTGTIWTTTWVDTFEEALIDDFLFMAGFEYIFKIEFYDNVEFYPEYDVKLTDIILPPKSTNLTDQEEVTVSMINNGLQNITDNIYFSFRVNDGAWTEPETLSVSFNPWEEITYTFITKADFSESGTYKVQARVDYHLDMNTTNNRITGYTRNLVPSELPFIANFDTPEELEQNWTIINVNDQYFGNEWMWIPFITGLMDPDGNIGYLQVGVSPWANAADDYLISEPVIMPEVGTYNLSFYMFSPASGASTESFRVLYGTSPNYDEMVLLADFSPLSYSSGWRVMKQNIEIEVPGNYYFAFHYYTTKQFINFIYFDKVKIDFGPFVDISFKSVIVPLSSCNMSDEEVIGAVVYNNGTVPINEFTLTYQIDDSELVSQTFSDIIEIGESISVYFEGTIDFSEIGEYNIKFTVSTPFETNTNNNETEIKFFHFEPIKELPFVSDFSNEEDRIDWFPAIPGGWEMYYIYYNAWQENVPLLSRCVYLVPDTYRFTYIYSAGVNYGVPADFYITFGKSGTDPMTWESIKEYKNCINEWEIEDFIMFEILDAGEYVFAIMPVVTYDLTIHKTEFEFVPEHDFRIKNIEYSDFARITPKYQIEGEKTFTAVLQNMGMTANESGTIKLMLNNNELISQNFAFTESGEILNIELMPVFGTLLAGFFNIKINATISEGISKDWEILKIVSDSTFAFDNIDEYFFDGVGLRVPGGLGLIYELQKPDILTSITIGLYDDEYLENKEIILAVYEMGNRYPGDMIFEAKHLRTAGNNMDGITFSVPETELQAGRYFFEVRQLDSDNISIAYDIERDGSFYVYIPDEYYFREEFSYGHIHVRPNFGNSPANIEELDPEFSSGKNYELRIYPNPVRGELNIDNGELKMEKITIYNAAGQVVIMVSNVNDTSFSINTEKLNSGLYFISVQTKDGVINEKFVVK